MDEYTFTASNGQKIRCHPGLTRKCKKDCLTINVSGCICSFDSVENLEKIKVAFGELVQMERFDDSWTVVGFVS